MIIFVDCIKNRRKDEWRDRHEPTVDVNVARPDPADPEAPAVEPGADVRIHVHFDGA